MIYCFLLQLTLLAIAASREVCRHRDYGNGGTVCVCDVHHCDTLNPVLKTDTGSLTLYETSKSGKRFDETVLKFAKTDNKSIGVRLRIDRNTRYQRIIGFGGAFTDSTGINVMSLPAPLRTSLMSDYFSPAGIEYSVGRVPIGGTDFSTRGYTYCDTNNQTDLKLSNFALAEEDLAYKIPLIVWANQLREGRLKLLACPWSAPKWMKTSGTLLGGGYIIGSPGGHYYQSWANYFVKFLDAYKEFGIDFWGVSVQNEPSDGTGDQSPINVLGFTPELERDFIKLNLGPTLEKAGYGRETGFHMLAGDDLIETHTLFGAQTVSIDRWADTVYGDSESGKYVTGVGFHWYMKTADSARLLDATHAAHPDLLLLATEACNGYWPGQPHVLLGSWDYAEEYARDILMDLNHWTQAWVDWNMALDTGGGPNWVDNYVDAPVIVNASAREYYKQPMFYALGHFSKFLVTDSVRVGLGLRGGLTLETVAFVRPDGANVVIVFNGNDDGVDIVIEDPDAGVVSSFVEPRSLQTYIWWN